MHALLVALLAGATLQTPTPLRLQTGVGLPGPFARPVVPEAYFILHATDMLRAPWPDAYAKYSLFVGSGSFSAFDVARAHWFKDTKLLAYQSAKDVGVAAGFSGQYWIDLAAVFDTTWCIIDLDADECVRMTAQQPAWIPTQESAEVLAEFHRNTTMALSGWDGMYIDEATATYPAWRVAELPANFDCDGDGLPNTVQQLQDQWATWMPYFLEQMRGAVGAEILVANTAGTYAQDCLNGTTIEGIGDTITEEDAVASFELQRSIGTDPFLGIAWITEELERQPSGHVVSLVPGTYLGTVVP